MNAPAENVAPCALLLGTILLDKPSSSTVMPLLEGLASMDLPAEWPYGDEATLERISQQLRRALKTAPADLDRDYHRCSWAPASSRHRRGDRSTSIRNRCCSATRASPWAAGCALAASNCTKGKAASRRPYRAHARATQLALRQPAGSGHPFMEEHLMTWAPRYFAQLEPAAAGTLYEPLGHLASLTLEASPSFGNPSPPVSGVRSSPSSDALLFLI